MGGGGAQRMHKGSPHQKLPAGVVQPSEKSSAVKVKQHPRGSFSSTPGDTEVLFNGRPVCLSNKPFPG